MVAGKLGAIERLDRSGRMRATDWQNAIKEYGRTLREPPRNDFEAANVVPLRGQEDCAWSVWYRLWTKEEGRSDLTVELTVRLRGDDVEIDADGLRVP